MNSALHPLVFIDFLPGPSWGVHEIVDTGFGLLPENLQNSAHDGGGVNGIRRAITGGQQHLVCHDLCANGVRNILQSAADMAETQNIGGLFVAPLCSEYATLGRQLSAPIWVAPANPALRARVSIY